MKNLHWIAIAGLFLSSCEAKLRDGWSLYFDKSFGDGGVAGLVSLRREIHGGQESWYAIPYYNFKEGAGIIVNHGVSNDIYR